MERLSSHIAALSIGFILFAINLAGYSQESMREIKAERAYNNFAYFDAIERLRSISKPTTPQLRMLAQSYVKTGNSIDAELTYAEIVAREDFIPEDYLEYSQTLLSNEKHAEHVRVMSAYAAQNSADFRGSSVLKDPDYHGELLIESEKYSIKNLAMNSVHDDFATFFFGDQIGFATTNASPKLIKKVYSWNERAFLDLNLARINENGELDSIAAFPKQFNTELHEATGALTPNGKYFYFTRNNLINNKSEVDENGVNNLQLYFIQMTDKGWSDEKPISFNSKNYSVGHPSISSDGKTMYFASDMPGSIGGVDIWKCSILSDGVLTSPENLGSTINTEGDEMFPFIDAQNNLYFASNGHPGLGMLDLFKSSVGGTPQNLGAPMNSPKDDFALVYSEQLSGGFFSSNREDGKGNDDIYSFKIQRSKYFLNGLVVDNTTGESVGNVSLVMTDEPGKTFNVVSDSNGEWKSDVELNKRYHIQTYSSNYQDALDTLNVNNPIRLAYNSVVRLTPLDSISLAAQNSEYTLNGLVLASITGAPISGAEVSITAKSGINQTIVSDENGEWHSKVLLDDMLKAEISAATYLPNSDQQHIDDPLQYVYNSVVRLDQDPSAEPADTLQFEPVTAKDLILASGDSTTQYRLNGLVVSSKTGEAIEGARVRLTSKAGMQETFVTDENGEWQTNVLYSDEIDVAINSSSYLPGEDHQSIDDSLQLVYNSVVGLDQDVSNLISGTNNSSDDPKDNIATDEDDVSDKGTLPSEVAEGIYTITGRVIERMHSNPLSDVTLEFVHPKSASIDYTYTTNASGTFYDSLPDVLPKALFEYNVRLTKPGYITKTAPFDTLLGSTYGLIDLEDFLLKHFQMLKADVGADLADLLDINPIYFDLDKSNIRPDAAIELDKIVEVMTQNPNLEIEFGSHTDCRASVAYNLALSERRAKSSAAYVQSRIDNPKRIYGKGYGESKLVNDCGCEGAATSDCTEEAHQLNRRTEFRITRVN